MKVPDETGTLQDLDGYLDRTHTAAFVVLREDRVVYERYSRGFDERSLLNSFSIAKSIMATLVGIAVAEGRIDSLDATVAQYRPDFAGTPYGAVTIKSLLTMTSGMGDRTSLLPGRAQFYYGDDLHGVVEGSRPEARGANGWRYSEADVQMLGFVLQAAVGKSVSEYLAEKLWKPLGMESPALWAMDRENGMEKTFCCISARARDFARFGRLYLDSGRSNGEQIVPASWASRSVVPGVRTPDGYTHQHLWWTPEGNEGDFYAYGHNGQYVYVNPNARVVIVKFSETNRQDPLPMFRAVSAALKTTDRIAEVERLAADTVAAR
jgi:CubicO group peptidase (beta-lactamase class C family)